MLLDLVQQMYRPVCLITRNGSATESTDYLKASGILGFAPGETSKDINVRTLSDGEIEDDEDFYVLLIKDSPGTIAAFAQNNVAKGVITDSPIKHPVVPQLLQMELMIHLLHHQDHLQKILQHLFLILLMQETQFLILKLMMVTLQPIVSLPINLASRKENSLGLL